jgi:hypothetical protein
MRVVALGSIVRTDLGSQRRHFFNTLDPFRETLRRNFSEVRAVASRNGLYRILETNVAVGV